MKANELLGASVTALFGEDEFHRRHIGPSLREEFPDFSTPTRASARPSPLITSTPADRAIGTTSCRAGS